MKKIDVQLPTVKMRIDDVVYLRYLADITDKTPQCASSGKKAERLLYLGLIEDVKLSPCPKRVAEFEKLRAAAMQQIRAAMNAKPVDWDALNSAPIHRCRDNMAPGPRVITRVTEAGKALLKDGSAKTEVVGACR